MTMQARELADQQSDPSLSPCDMKLRIEHMARHTLVHVHTRVLCVACPHTRSGMAALAGLHSYGLYSYGLYSHGLYSYGLCSYGLCSYGLYSYGL